MNTNPAFDWDEYELIVPRKTEKRLRGTCYRNQQTAGCFINWRSSYDLFNDPLASDLVEEQISEIVDEMDNAGLMDDNQSFTIEMPCDIGWSSTISQTELDEAVALERKPLNRRANAMFVIDPRIPAPLTKLVTFVAQIKFQGDWVAIIHSIYPGPDIGELKGNITRREKVVFFDWDTPGEPL